MRSFKLRVTSKLAVLAALGFFTGNLSAANAADLGGNCCADLEERIADLEATTARKGNRKVKLAVTGWINEALFFWDDGVESNTYIGTNSLEQGRVNLKGEAKISDGWSAGYRLELGVNGNPSGQFDQDRDQVAAFNNAVVRQSNWFVKSKTYGQLTLGLTGTATYHLLDDAAPGATRNFSDFEATGVAQARFFLRSGGSRTAISNLRWNQVLRGVNNATPGQNGRRNVVRYDTPEIAGFVGTISWGEDDQLGGALSYKQTFGDFKVIGKLGYENSRDEGAVNNTACSSNADRTVGVGAAARILNLQCEWFGVGGSIVHEPTGLFVYGGYGAQFDESEKRARPATAGRLAANSTDRTWYIQAGIEKEWLPDGGKTTLFGEYRNDDLGSNVGAGAAFGSTASGIFVQGSQIDSYAAGIVQGIVAGDSVQLYAMYRYADGVVRNSAGVSRQIDGFDQVIAGAKVTY